MHNKIQEPVKLQMRIPVFNNIKGIKPVDPAYKHEKNSKDKYKPDQAEKRH
jgi:hypothetical protein